MKVKTHNAIIRLSKNAEREQRIPKAKENAYERPMLAGAYYLNGETMICNGFYAIIFNDLIPDLQMVEAQGEYIDCHKFFEPDFPVASGTDECEFTPTNEQFTQLNNSKYQTKYVKMLVDALEDCKLYNKADATTSALTLKGSNGIAILMPIRPDKKESK